jgi:integrase
MITMYKRGKVFWIQSSLYGIQKRYSLKTRDRITAEAIKRRIEMQTFGVAPKSFPEFANEFELSIKSQLRPKTQKYYSFVLTRLEQFCQKRFFCLLTDITPAVINEYMEERRLALHPSRKRVMTDGGGRAYLRVLHRIFSYAVELEYIRKNPVIGKNRNAVAGRTKPFSPDEVTTMLTTPYLDDKAYLRAIVLVFLHTGLRIGDVIDLKKADIEGEYLSVTARKNDSALRLPIMTELGEALNVHLARQLPEQKTSANLFTTANGSPIVGLDKHLRRLFSAAGVSRGHAHRFRDTFAVSLLAHGASLYDVAKLLGINASVVEAHYAPYVKELQERGRRLVSKLNYSKAIIDPAPGQLEDVERINAKVWKN